MNNFVMIIHDKIMIFIFSNDRFTCSFYYDSFDVSMIWLLKIWKDMINLSVDFWEIRETYCTKNNFFKKILQSGKK